MERCPLNFRPRKVSISRPRAAFKEYSQPGAISSPLLYYVIITLPPLADHPQTSPSMSQQILLNPRREPKTMTEYNIALYIQKIPRVLHTNNEGELK